MAGGSSSSRKWATVRSSMLRSQLVLGLCLVAAVACDGSQANATICPRPIGVLPRRAASRTQEPYDSLEAIARGAVAAHQRAGRLCDSALPVPSAVPAGGTAKMVADPRAGKGYDTGSPRAGWRCLKHGSMSVQYFQFGYDARSGFRGPARGLPDPGPHGFEAWAVGDLDGDGRKSLFTLVGHVDPKTGVASSGEVHCIDPDA
jgi:hypothetical protein